MKKYYKERFELQRRVARVLAPALEVNEILEDLREEARAVVATAMEACVLLLDTDAYRYTRPLQCALHDRSSWGRIGAVGDIPACRPPTIMPNSLSGIW